MVVSPQQPLKMAIAEYLEWESQQEVRHEYVNGAVFAMTGGTISHNDIALNLYTALPKILGLKPRRSRRLFLSL